jgi:ankyrin repeat protein
MAELRILLVILIPAPIEMPLLSLPNELLLLIGEYIASEADLNSFLRTNHRLHDLLLDYLYQYNIKHHSSECLHWAAEHGILGTLKKAINQGANVNAGMNLIHRVSGKGFFIDSKMTPLSRAAAKGHKGLVSALLDAGADVEAKRGQFPNIAPIVHAMDAEQGSLETIQILINHGADVNRNGDYAEAPLLRVVEKGKVEIADPKKRNGPQSPLDRAEAHNDQALIKLLRDYGGMTYDEMWAVQDS